MEPAHAAAYRVLADARQRAVYDAQLYLRPRATVVAAQPRVRPVVIVRNDDPTPLQRRVDRIVAVVGVLLLALIGFYAADSEGYHRHFTVHTNWLVLAGAVGLALVTGVLAVDPEQLQRFIAERTACVVGIKTMQRFGWKVGDRITLMGAMTSTGDPFNSVGR